MKIIKTVGVAGISVVLLTASVSAEDNIKFYENILPDGGFSFVVEGYTENKKANSEVNVMILNPGYDLTQSEGTFGGEYLNQQGFAVADTNGYFKIELPIMFDGENDSGEYICYVGGEGFSQAKKIEGVYIGGIDDKTNAVLGMKNAQNKDEFCDALIAAETQLSLTDELYNAWDKESVAETLFNNKALLDEGNPAEAIKTIRRFAFVDAFNKSKTELIYSNGEYLYSDLIDFSAIDTDGADLYENGYMKILSASGKSKLLASMTGNNYGSPEELVEDFKVNLIINAIKYPKNSGTGHIEELLTKANAKCADIEIPKFLAIKTSKIRTSACEKIKKASFEDKADLETVVEKAAKEAENSNQHNNGGGGSSGGGGSAAAGNSSMQIIYGDNKQNINDVVVNEEELNSEAFDDLDTVIWAKDAIMSLYDKGIVSGIGEKKFAPNDNVTREQFVVMLMKAMGIEPDSSETVFEDVVKNSWYEKYLSTAKSKGIVNGISETEFGVGKYLKRQDLAVILKNAVDKTGIEIVSADKNAVFTDETQISAYAQEAVKFFTNAGVINGFEDSTFRPMEYCTRAQAAKLIHGIIK